MTMGGGAMADHDVGMNMTMPPSPTSSMPMRKKMMMHMTFFWGTHVEILFSGFPGHRGVPTYLLALFLVFTAAFLVELLSFIPIRSSRHRGVLMTALVAFKTGLSYSVMLAVMSFNVGVLMAAILGHALGFFVFGTGLVFQWGGDEKPQGIGNKC